MSALEPLPSDALPELLMRAARQLTEAGPGASVLAPVGVPVRGGRLHLGRLRQRLHPRAPVAVVAGFSTVCWLGPMDGAVPDLGQLQYRTETKADARGRVILDLRVRAWLGVPDPKAFDVVTVPGDGGAVLVVPIDDFARRWAVISR